LGVGLGYFSARILRYIVALIGIIIVGMILSMWQIEGLKEKIIGYGFDWGKAYALIQAIITTFGVTIILPLALGFFLGVILAVKK